MDKITFVGCIGNIKMDREGETKITLDVPLSELEKILELGKLNGKLLKVEIQEEIN